MESGIADAVTDAPLTTVSPLGHVDLLPRRGKLPFAARFQGLLIGVMVVGMLLIVQRWSKSLYQVGLPLLIVTALLQVAFGNIPPDAGFGKSMKLLALTWAIVIAVFALGVFLAPYLIEL